MTEKTDAQVKVDIIATMAVRVAEGAAEILGVELDGLVVLARLEGEESALAAPEGTDPEAIAAALLGALMAVCRVNDIPFAVADLPHPPGQG